LHINEYAGGRVHLSPGWNVAYLRYIIDAEVDAAMRACWYVFSTPPYEYWSNCWDGMNAMFMNDGFTPTHAYWVYRHYAAMAGGERLLAVSNSYRTTVLASIDGEETLRILLGRHWQGAPGDVTLRVLDYPFEYGRVRVDGGRIPHDPLFFADPPRILPLPEGPVETFSVARDVIDGSFVLELEDFADNDAYVVTIIGETATAAGETPSPRLLLENATPNPFNPRTLLRFRLPEAGRAVLDIHDLAGRRLIMLVDATLAAGEHGVAWDGRDARGRPAAAGIYLARLAAGGEISSVRLVLVK
jgi:hypothetical protein